MYPSQTGTVGQVPSPAVVQTMSAMNQSGSEPNYLIERNFPTLNMSGPRVVGDLNMNTHLRQAAMHNIPSEALPEILTHMNHAADQPTKTPILCGLSSKTVTIESLSDDCADPDKAKQYKIEENGRIYTLWSDFFQNEVEVFQAFNDPQGQILYKAKKLAKKFNCASNLISMYLHRRKAQNTGGIFQSLSYVFKRKSSRGLKIGGYYITLEVCKALSEHIVGARIRSAKKLGLPLDSIPQSHHGGGSNTDGSGSHSEDDELSGKRSRDSSLRSQLVEGDGPKKKVAS